MGERSCGVDIREGEGAGRQRLLSLFQDNQVLWSCKVL